MKPNKRSIFTPFLLLFVFTFFFYFCPSPKRSFSATPSSEPTVAASSAILVDANTGQVLFEKNIHVRRPIASTTKVMTAILVLENSDLSSVVKVSKKATEAGEAELYLTPDETRTVSELLYGLLLRSANDAAVALAEYVSGGSMEKFVQMMNEKAKSLGAVDTNFLNPHGFTRDPNHHSTAYDLSVIARYALKNQIFAQTVATKKITIPWPGMPSDRVIENHNKLLTRYPYANGVKTGYIKESAYCLIGSATKNNIQLLTVVLNSPTSPECYQDTERLLEYGFNSYTPIEVVTKDKTYLEVSLPVLKSKKLDLVAQDGLVLQVKKGSPAPSSSLSILEPVVLPVSKGQKMGALKVTLDGQDFGEVNLIAREDVRKPSFFQRIWLFLYSIY